MAQVSDTLRHPPSPSTSDALNDTLLSAQPRRGPQPLSLTIQLTESGTEPQSYTVLLPRTTGLGTLFSMLRNIVAIKAHLVDVERIGDPRVDGMLVPLR